MRAPVILIVGLVVAVCIGLLLYRHHPAQPVAPVEVTDVAPATVPPVTPAPAPVAPAVVVMTNVPAVTNAPVELTQEEAVAEMTRLNDLTTANPPAAVAEAEADLDSTSKDVRFAAAETLKQIGDKSAIETLQAKAVAATDPNDKIEFQQAAEFLATPAFREDISAEQAANRISQAKAARAAAQAAQAGAGGQPAQPPANP